MTQTTWSETDALTPKGPTLAALMLARGAQLAGPTTAVTEQGDDVAAIEIGEVPADAPCNHPSCAHADPASPCRCSYCLGVGHGWVTALAQDATRAKTQARIDAAGGIFEALRKVGALAPDDEPW